MNYAAYLIETSITLVAVVAIAFLVLYGARRMGVLRARGPIRLVGQLTLEARRSIYLVRVGEQVLVVGACEGGMTKLGELDASHVPVDAEPAHGSPFASVLARALSRAREDRSRANDGAARREEDLPS